MWGSAGQQQGSTINLRIAGGKGVLQMAIGQIAREIDPAVSSSFNMYERMRKPGWRIWIHLWRKFRREKTFSPTQGQMEWTEDNTPYYRWARPTVEGRLIREENRYVLLVKAQDFPLISRELMRFGSLDRCRVVVQQG